MAQGDIDIDNGNGNGGSGVSGGRGSGDVDIDSGASQADEAASSSVSALVSPRLNKVPSTSYASAAALVSQRAPAVAVPPLPTAVTRNATYNNAISQNGNEYMSNVNLSQEIFIIVSICVFVFSFVSQCCSSRVAKTWRRKVPSICVNIRLNDDNIHCVFFCLIRLSSDSVINGPEKPAPIVTRRSDGEITRPGAIDPAANVPLQPTIKKKLPPLPPGALHAANVTSTTTQHNSSPRNKVRKM